MRGLGGCEENGMGGSKGMGRIKDGDDWEEASYCDLLWPEREAWLARWFGPKYKLWTGFRS